MAVVHGVERAGEGVDPALVAERGLGRAACAEPFGELGFHRRVGAQAHVVAALLVLDVLVGALLVLADPCPRTSPWTPCACATRRVLEGALTAGGLFILGWSLRWESSRTVLRAVLRCCRPQRAAVCRSLIYRYASR